MSAPSRRARYVTAVEMVARASDSIGELRDELQDWLDNMPENLQGSSKAEQLQEAIEELEAVIDLADEIVGTEIEFPGMCG